MARKDLINGMEGSDFRTSINENFVEVYNKLSTTEIKNAYESNSDTNVYTDSEKAKLDLISVTTAVDLDNIQTFTNGDLLEVIDQELSETSDVTFKSITITDGLDLNENVITVNSNTSVTIESVILCDTTSSSITITIPDAVSGNKIYLKKLNTNGTVTVIANDSASIEDNSDLVLSSQYASVTLICDGSNWYII